MNNSVNDGGSSIILSTSSTPSISYFVEYRARLRVVQVFLTCLGFPDGPGTVTLTVPSTDGLNATISWQRDAAGPLELATTSLIFPTAVAKTAITRQVEKLDGEHSFKLVALPNSSAENSQMVPLRSPLSAQELQSLNASTLICSECSSHIVKLCDPIGSSPITFRNLPSAHWREIADAWLCHPQGGDDFTKRYSKKMEEGFWPDKETVLVSLWELWFDQSRMVGSYIPSQESIDAWSPFPCDGCGRKLGSVYVSRLASVGDKSDATTLDSKFRVTLKLLKYTISITSGTKSVHYPSERLVVSEMLEMAQTHSTPRFLVKEAGVEGEDLLVWLFNPDVIVTDGPVSFLEQEGETVHHCVRLLYGPLPKETTAESKGPAKLQILEYETVPFNAFKKAMKESTALLPSSQRQIGGFQVAVLPR